jgi:alkanesulfonate monooxygenase SsuD/methylene tetrahydromethanopterin reductase-like flavin-dependent oxidoreductase (luciferase family)
VTPATTPPARIGVLIIPTDPWPVAVARARQVEALGFAHLWTYDHLSWRRYRDHPWHATIPWLTGIAAATSTIRLGTMVTSPNFRHPVTLAKDAMTLDHICDGRLTLGIGAGGVGFDADVLGQARLTPGQRANRLHDFVEMLDGILRQQEYSGSNTHYTAHGAQMLPGCVQRPRVPLAVAAGGPRTMRTAARYADAWITDGLMTAELPADEADARMRTHVEQVAQACEANGRDPLTLQRIRLVGNTDERPLASLRAFIDFVGRQEDLGFTDIVFHDPRPDDPNWNDDPAVVEEIAGWIGGRSPRSR